MTTVIVRSVGLEKRVSAKAEQASLAILEKFIKLENLEGPGSGKMCSLCNSGTLH